MYSSAVRMLVLTVTVILFYVVSVHADYPFFNDDDWKLSTCSPDADCEANLDVLHKYKKEKVMDRLFKMSLSANRNLESSGSLDELRLVVIGKTGQGKSATANTLLDKAIFKEDYGHRSVTKKAQLGTSIVAGRKINVFDTPGIQDTDTNQTTTLEEITRIFSHYDQGVHAFLYIINLADPRFTKEDSEVLTLLEETFGGNFLNYCILVFTHGNELQVDLDAWCTHQRAVANEDADDEGPGEVSLDSEGFAGLINTLSWRVVAIDNSHCSPYEAERHQNVVFAMVDKMKAKNIPPVYTHAFFKEAQAEKKRLRQEVLKEGWEADELEMVEEIIAGNPDITRDDLIKEVNEWLLERNRKAKPEQQIYHVQRNTKNVFSWLWEKVKNVFRWFTG